MQRTVNGDLRGAAAHRDDRGNAALAAHFGQRSVVHLGHDVGVSGRGSEAGEGTNNQR